MTGFGEGTAELPGARLTVQLKSLNHRFADLRVRLPQELSSSEPELRRKVMAHVKRGRVDLNVQIDGAGEGRGLVHLDRELLSQLLAAAASLKREFSLAGEPDLSTILAVPGIVTLSPRPGATAAACHAAAVSALERALEALDLERRREGERIQRDILARLRAISAVAADLERAASAAPGALHERLLERLRMLGATVALDPTRVAQEAALLAERADVTEELVRLAGHLEQSEALLARPDGEPVGKRLDFLLQELQRETNTIGAKAADLAVSRGALALKGELEKVREQIQNLE